MRLSIFFKKGRRFVLSFSFIITFFFVFCIFAVLLDFKIDTGLFYSIDEDSYILFSSITAFGF
jgi:hypothetical protein